MEEIYYPNMEVARMLGIPDSTIRTWKSRYPDRLIEEKHWLKNSDGSVLWTETGLAELRDIKSSNNRNGNVSRPKISETETSQSSTDPIERYRPLLKKLATLLTPQLLQELDKEVTQQLGDALVAPMSETECVTVLLEMGLNPADPTILITGENVAGYLEGETDKEDA